MCYEISFFCKAFIAEFAHMFLQFTRVFALVPYHIALLCKAPATMLACIRSFTSMDTQVHFQSTLLLKALTTLRALKRLFTYVDTLGTFQITFLCKALITLIVLIRLLTLREQQRRILVTFFLGCFCKERVRVFFYAGGGAVGTSSRWRATDIPLAYITFAVIAMLDKWPEL